MAKHETETGIPILQCEFHGKHTAHPYGALQDGGRIITYHCPGVGAVTTCSACGTVNLAEAEKCVECGLTLGE